MNSRMAGLNFHCGMENVSECSLERNLETGKEGGKTFHPGRRQCPTGVYFKDFFFLQGQNFIINQ